MDTNEYCSCGQIPTRFCMCQKPTKIFLCGLCLSTHVSKPGSHTLFETSVKDILDPDLQNARRRIVIETSTKLDQMTTDWLKQWEALEGTINDMYKEECEKVWKRLQEVHKEVAGCFQGMWDVLGRIKEEMKMLETQMKVDLSKESIAFLQLSCHPEISAGACVNVREEAAKLNERRLVTNCEEIRANWRCPLDGCPSCVRRFSELCVEWPLSRKNAKTLNQNPQGMQFPSQVQTAPQGYLNTQSYRMPPSSGMGGQGENPQGMQTGQMGGQPAAFSQPQQYPNPNYGVSATAPQFQYQLPPTNPSGQTVSHQIRQESAPSETHANQTPAYPTYQPPRFLGLSQFLDLPALPKEKNYCWMCFKCNIQILSTSSSCPSCGYVNLNAPEPSMQPKQEQEEPQGFPMVWTCPKCKYEYNLQSARRCRHCGKQKPQPQISAANPQEDVAGNQFQGQAAPQGYPNTQGYLMPPSSGIPKQWSY